MYILHIVIRGLSFTTLHAYTVWTVNVCFWGIHRESTVNPPSEKLPKLLVNPAHLKKTLKVDSRWIPIHFSFNFAKSISRYCGILEEIHLDSTFKVFFRCAGFTNNFGNFSEGGFQVDSRWIPKNKH